MTGKLYFSDDCTGCDEDALGRYYREYADCAEQFEYKCPECGTELNVYVTFDPTFYCALTAEDVEA